MPEIIEIEEVNGRADGGVSARPFRCRGMDGRDYYVKLGNARPDGLIAEWVCGHLGRAMGLPVADVSLVRVDPGFKRCLPPEFAELGHGVGFGSVAAPRGCREALFSDITARIDHEVLADLLAFDAWIRNEDRKLGPAGGNPNALFVPNADEPLVLIDHDSAFDRDFDPIRFLDGHLARAQAPLWLARHRREHWCERASAALQKLDAVWDSIPEEWLVGPFGDIRTTLDRRQLRSLLERPEVDPLGFWKIVVGR